MKYLVGLIFALLTFNAAFAQESTAPGPKPITVSSVLCKESAIDSLVGNTFTMMKVKKVVFDFHKDGSCVVLPSRVPVNITKRYHEDTFYLNTTMMEKAEIEAVIPALPEHRLTALWCNYQRQHEFNPPPRS